jgi:hypothetical protein
VSWLHRLLDYRNKMLTQLAQVQFIAECRSERFQRFGTVILAPVEATVDDRLDAMAQGLEECCNDEGRDHDSDSVILVEHPLEQRLQSKNEAKVQQSSML